MTTLLHDVLLFEEDALVEVGVEIGFHGGVGQVGSPADEVVDGTLGTVGVVDFEAVALGHEVVVDGAKAVGSLAGEQGGGLEVAVDAGADEVVGAEVADFEDGVGNSVGEGDEGLAVVGRTEGFILILRAAREECERNGQKH